MSLAFKVKIYIKSNELNKNFSNQPNNKHQTALTPLAQKNSANSTYCDIRYFSTDVNLFDIPNTNM